MERRKFLKFTAWGSLGFSAAPWSVVYGNSQIGVPKDEETPVLISKEEMINPLVPVKFFHNRKESIYRQILELKEKYGLQRFLICEPTDEVKLSGFPKPSAYQKIGELILEIKSKLAPHDIEIGWWCAPSIRSGYDSRFQNITDLNGKVSDASPCPLDPVYREEFSDNIATVVRIAKPTIIQFEDDFELSWQPPNVTFGCFCPRHVAEFSEREGKNYTRESLLDLFKTNSEESIRVRRKWSKLSCDTLVDFALLIREKVDLEEPATRISLCQSSLADFDGDFTEAVTRAFAGSTKPLVRLYGSSYSSDKSAPLPADIFHAMYSKQHIGDDIECMHESDSYPHTRFFMSASKLKSLMTAAFAYGFDNSLFYGSQYLDNMLEEKGYFEMFRNERNRLSALKKAVKNTYVVGPRMYHDPSSHALVPYKPKVSGWFGIPLDAQNSWVDVFGRFGIPYTAKESPVTAISGVAVRLLSDTEIEGLLSKGVLLDGTAAHELSTRGFGHLIGAEVSKGTVANFCYEGIRTSSKHANIKGELMYNFIFSPAGGEGGDFYVLDTKPGVEIITDFLDPNEKPIIPGLIWFENKLGGRVAVSAFDLFENNSSAVFNYKKKELIKETVEWLGREELPVFVKDQPNVFCIGNLAKSNDFLIVTIISLCSDPVHLFTLDVATEWKSAIVEILQPDGNWQRYQPKITGRSLTFETLLGFMDPVVVRLSK